MKLGGEALQRQEVMAWTCSKLVNNKSVRDGTFSAPCGVRVARGRVDGIATVRKHRVAPREVNQISCGMYPTGDW